MSIVNAASFIIKNVAVGFDFGFGQRVLPPEGMVIVENAVMGQRKLLFRQVAAERMIVAVPLRCALGGHTGMAHDYFCRSEKPNVPAAAWYGG